MDARDLNHMFFFKLTQNGFRTTQNKKTPTQEVNLEDTSFRLTVV